MRKSRILAVIVFASLSVLLSTSFAKADVPTVELRTEDYDLTFGDATSASGTTEAATGAYVMSSTVEGKKLWYINPNPWAVQSATGSVSIEYKDGEVVTTAKISDIEGSFGGYPYIQYGRGPWGKEAVDQAPQFPIKVTDAASFTSDVNYTLSVQEMYGSIMYDLWLTKTADSENPYGGVEVTIWLWRKNNNPSGWPLYKETTTKPVKVNGVDLERMFYVYVTKATSENDWDIVSFAIGSPSYSSGDIELNLLDFINHALLAADRSDDLYLQGVQFGTEFTHMDQDYTFTVNKFDIKQTLYLENCCDGIDNDGDGLEDGRDPYCQTNTVLNRGENEICWWTEWDDYSNNADYFSGWFSCPEAEAINMINITVYTEDNHDFFQIYDTDTSAIASYDGKIGNNLLGIGSFGRQRIKFRFVSDGSGVDEGAKVNSISCTDSGANPALTECTGAVGLTLNPNPAQPNKEVTATVSGLSGCGRKTVSIKDGECSGTGEVKCYCTVSGTGCSCNFNGEGGCKPLAQPTYYVCVDKNDDGDYSDSGESDSEVLNMDCETKTVSIDLEMGKSGWNIISFPLKGATFTTTCSDYSKIMRYHDPATDIAKPVTITSIDKMPEDVSDYYEKGWWFKTNEDCSITLSGGEKLLTSDLPELKKGKSGWNIISVPYDGLDITKEKGDCNILAGPYRHDPATDKLVYETVLKAGYGYWVRVENDCQLS